jgi:hypothetical protein
VTGDVSVDGRAWTSLAVADFAAPLAHQGIASSSHDKTAAVHFLFANVTRTGPISVGALPDVTVLKARDLSWTARVGANDGSVWDGFRAP